MTQQPHPTTRPQRNSILDTSSLTSSIGVPAGRAGSSMLNSAGGEQGDDTSAFFELTPRTSQESKQDEELTVDLGLGEPPRGDPVFEQDLELSVRFVARLR